MNRAFAVGIAAWTSILLLAGCGGGNLQNNFHSPDTPSGNSATPSSNFSVSLAPASPTLVAGQSVNFTSPFIGSVVWKVNGVEGGDAVHGTIDKVGNYTSPAVAPTDPVTVSAELGTFSNPPSVSTIVTIQNPSPRVDLMTPATLVAGTTSTIVLAGSGFNPASQITLAGNTLPTVYGDTNHLSAQLSADVFQSAGTFDVAVVNPSPGGA